MSLKTLLCNVISLFFHVPMMNINTFEISKTCFAIAGPFKCQKMIEFIALCSSLKGLLLIKLKCE